MFATAAASVKVTYSRKHKRRQHCGHSASEMSSETTVSKRRPLDDGHWSVCEVNAQPDEIPTLNAEATQISNGYGSTASPSSNMKAQIFVGQRVAVYWKGNKQWFEGTVIGVQAETGQHIIRYDDGEQTAETLQPLLYRMLPSAAPRPSHPLAPRKSPLSPPLSPSAHKLADKTNVSTNVSRAEETRQPHSVPTAAASWPIAWCRDRVDGRESISVRRKKTDGNGDGNPRTRSSNAIARASTFEGDGGQWVMDLRQRGFATTCPTCGMLYNRGHVGDEATHKMFHRQFENRIRFQGWKEERILRRLPTTDISEREARIVAVHSGDKPAHLLKLAQIKLTMDSEMGSESTKMEPILSPESDDRAFLYISANGNAIGCAIVQRVSTAFRIASDGRNVRANSGDNDHESCIHTQLHTSSNVSDVITPMDKHPDALDIEMVQYNLNELQPCRLGVRQMWVHKQYRRQHVMSVLLDTARAAFNFGTVVPRSELAFTQTTIAGRKFATAYCGTRGFLVYEVAYQSQDIVSKGPIATTQNDRIGLAPWLN